MFKNLRVQFQKKKAPQYPQPDNAWRWTGSTHLDQLGPSPSLLPLERPTPTADPTACSTPAPPPRNDRAPQPSVPFRSVPFPFRPALPRSHTERITSPHHRPAYRLLLPVHDGRIRRRGATCDPSRPRGQRSARTHESRGGRSNDSLLPLPPSPTLLPPRRHITRRSPTTATESPLPFP